LRVLNASRKTPRPGDIFALSPAEDLYLFGRVISGDARVGRIPATLIYIYSTRQSAMRPIPMDQLTPDGLLIPPILTNRLPWSRGYFQVVASMPLREGDRLADHRFRDVRGWLFDEFGEPRPPTDTFVGSYGLDSFRTIDDAVSDAMSLPRART
jgi:hypothetical protein